MAYCYTYVLKSLKNGKLYIGFTNDINERVKRHNQGQVECTAKRRPLKLIYFEWCLNRDDAIEREKSLKSGFGRAYLKRRISNLKSI